MQVLVLSRFNVVHRKVGDARDRRRMDDRRFNRKWMKARLDLMTRYTASSLRDQSNKNFDWFVFVQLGTPQSVMNDIEELGAQVVEVEIDDIEGAQRTVRQKRGWVATVNLDTDDAISRDFISEVHKRAREKEDRFAFLRGCRHREQSDAQPWTISYKSETNPFQVVTEPAKDAKTVFNQIHNKPSRMIDTDHPMWLMLLHGDNIDNRSLERTKRDVNIFSIISQYFSVHCKQNYGRCTNRS